MSSNNILQKMYQKLSKCSKSVLNRTQYCVDLVKCNLDNLENYQHPVLFLLFILLIQFFGLEVVLNGSLLVYYLMLNVERITLKSTNTDILVIYGCCFSSQLYLESVINQFLSIKYQYLILKLCFYVWAFHPKNNGYLKIYSYLSNLLEVKNDVLNENIFNALGELEKRQIEQSIKLKKVYNFYKKLNNDLDKYEKLNQNIFPIKAISYDERSIADSADSLYVHPPSDLSLKNCILEMEAENGRVEEVELSKNTTDLK